VVVDFCVVRTAIVWRGGQKLYEIKGHAFGVEVLTLPNGDIVTASGTRDKGTITIWRGQEKIHENEIAHKREFFFGFWKR
jgi:hypothetical protein